MIVMSFNTQHCLNYVEQKIDFEIMARAIKQCDADVVGLNEIHGEGKDEEYTDQTKTLSELTGLENHYFAKATYIDNCGPFGNAILSRYPIISVENIPIPDPEVKSGTELYETRCLLKAKLANGITVMITHFGLNHDEHLNAVRVVTENIEKEKCILMGDFNAEPDNEVLNPIRELLFDTAALYSSDLLSFPSIDPYKKIDYIFTSRDLKVITADIPNIVAADHRPHTAEIALD